MYMYEAKHGLYRYFHTYNTSKIPHVHDMYRLLGHVWLGRKTLSKHGEPIFRSIVKYLSYTLGKHVRQSEMAGMPIDK